MAIDTAALNQKLQAFVTETSHVQGAALVTPTGLPIAESLPKGFEESRAAAMAAAAMTIGDRIGEELQRGPIQHILLTGSQGHSIVTLCGEETLFLVLAGLDVKQGILMLEIRRVVEEMAQIIG
ncbi:MAG: diacylglyceryl transferase [Phormidesmis sp. RL_2_1]|nr:diacylglyceryl transferase [Phormidesmis sp. RL_2_1]